MPSKPQQPHADSIQTLNEGDYRPDGENAGGVAVRGRDVAPPRGAVALVEFRTGAIEHALRYCRAERFVIFGYCPGGGEVIWKDGGSSGFGTGGWRIFLEEIAPVAQRYGINLGGVNYVGTHVLLIDRAQDAVYAVPRESAEKFLAEVNGIAPPKRPCLCTLLDCASCPVRTCPLAGIAQSTNRGPGISCAQHPSGRPDKRSLTPAARR